MARQNLFEEVSQVLKPFLGPATDRFLERQVEIHLKKSPRNLSAGDISELADWIKISIAMLTNDPHEIDRVVQRLNTLPGVEEYK